MSFVRQSKFRHVYGAPYKNDVCYNGVKPEGSGDTNCSVSGKFIAIINKSKIFVVPLEKTGRLDENSLPFIDCKSKVLDVQWSPYNDCVLASAEESGDINIWAIPEDGLQENMGKPYFELHDGHTRKVTTLQWHPSAEYIIAAAGADGFVTIWHCTEPEPIATVTDMPEIPTPTNIAWNCDGSILGITAKLGKTMCLILADPHTGEVISKNDSIYQGMKPAKLLFLNNGDVLTVGADRQASKSIDIWDKKTLEQKNQFPLDGGSGVVNTYYDGDLNILYLFGKGESTVKYYEIEESKSEIFFLTAYSSTVSQRGGNFIPKRCLNPATTEIARFYKLHSAKCEPIPLIVPRKSDHFQKDIYPPCISYEAAMTGEEFKSGCNKMPKRSEFQSGGGAAKKEAKVLAKPTEKKVPTKALPGKSAPVAASNNGLPEGLDLAELLEDMKKVKATVRKLNKRVTKLEEMLEQQGGDANAEEEEE